MRFALFAIAAFLLCLAPRLASAQEQVDRAEQAIARDVVDLQGVETDATGPRRSAFGRVMDLMIATLVEQQKGEREPSRHAKHHAALALDSEPPRAVEGSRKEPKIDIALGERFALPPTEAAIP